ncbi:MAG TPA: ACT domain-containing protein [Candidatus Paceibacterota bacterium]|nr:ACT domain-containing protein [Verrucomicrobiota bacterium]HRY50092.1 ACT domain-containing protein [Candidatus Paceibacterota bacterium]HRZ99436.1 ACT domain-containing protein [Candidatus Paceibacterota bacterium]
MSVIRLIAVFSENKVGQLSKLTGILAENGINIRCVTIATSEKFGVVKLLVDQPEIAWRKLQEQNLTVSWTDALAVEVEDKPGGLHRIAEALARHGINLENSSGFVACRRAILLVETSNPQEARRVLEEERFRLLTSSELMAI